MRIRWRGLELPSRVVRDDANSTDTYGRFVIEPFEQGFGTTIGNSLRRVLLSSLEGAAVSCVKIAGVSHEFCVIEGVLEDVTDIILNIKGIVPKLAGDEPKTMTVRRDKAGEVLAGDIVADPAITIANPEHSIATLTADVPFEVEMTVRKGRGYVPAAENRSPDQEVGVIPVDSVFSPVLRVRFRTENMRVGQLTNYDRLILEVWTRGTTLPEHALVEAALILRKHLNPFVMYDELGANTVVPQRAMNVVNAAPEADRPELFSRPIATLNLSVRASNCLEQAEIETIGDLVAMNESTLLRFRSFGKTSLHEVRRALGQLGLELGMTAEAMGAASAAGQDATAAGADDAQASVASAGDGGSDPAPGSGPMEVFTMGE